MPVIDAIEDEDLRCLGAACADLALATGGSGAAIGLPGNFRRAGLLATRPAEGDLPAVGGAAAVLSGSCSTATLAQVARMRAKHPSLMLDPLDLAERGEAAIADALAWAAAESEGGTGSDLCQRAAGRRESGAGEARPRPRRRIGGARARRIWRRAW